jgi:hypothetical protein
MTQTDIGFETGKKLWYIESFTNTRQFLGVQLVEDSNIVLDNVDIDTYSWAHDKYSNASNGRLRFYDDTCTITKRGAIADSVYIKGSEDNFNFNKLPKGDIEVKYNLETFDWTLTIDGMDYITRNFNGKISGKLLKERKRFVISNPESVLYSKGVTLIDSNLEIKNGK